MTKLFQIAALALAALSVASVAQAAATRINCPDFTAKYTVVSPLPDGWNPVSQSRAFDQAKIIENRGTTYLQCRYGNGARLRQTAPAGATCRADGRGFVCVTDAPPAGDAPAGHVRLRHGEAVDLDTDRVGRRGELTLTASGNGTQILYGGGAKFRDAIRRGGNFDCDTGSWSNLLVVNFADIRVGDRFCFITDQRNQGTIRITGKNARGLQFTNSVTR